MSFRLLPAFLTLALLSSVVQLGAQCLAGAIATNAPLLYGEVYACSNDGVSDLTEFFFTASQGSTKALVLTDENGRIIATSNITSFDFEGSPQGKCFVYGLAYTGQLATVVGERLSSSQLATGCAKLSPNRVAVVKQNPEAGLITTSFGETSVGVCVDDQVADFIGFKNIGSSNSQAYSYLITDTMGIIQHVVYAGFFNFQYTGVGISRVYGIAYNGGLLAQRGMNIFEDELARSCYDLSSAYVTVSRNATDGGRLLVDGRETVLMTSSTPQSFTIARTSSSDAAVMYVVLDQQYIIRQLQQDATINLSCFDPGKFFIYAYSYTGQVMAQLGEPLWNSGVPFASNCFSSSDNAIVVTKTSAKDCQPTCLADGGKLVASIDTLDLNGGTVMLMANTAVAATRPTGFELVYLLSQGDDQVIQAIQINSPEFSVTSTGDFRIHAFVAELTDQSSADFFALSQLTFGTSRIQDLIDKYTQQGLCADVSVPGAEFFVIDSAPASCTAFAGSILADSSSLTLQNGEARLTASPDGSAVIPAGFETRYLLTTGFTYTIEAIADAPDFIVSNSDIYTMHTLVGEFTDSLSSDYVNLSDIILGTTSAFDFLTTLFDAQKCVDMDFFGAEFSVTGGASGCTAFAGTMTATADTLQLPTSGPAVLSASVNGDAVVPVGFDRTFLLTEGTSDIIIAISARARFNVIQAGEYSIHAFVGEFTDVNSPDYINLQAISLNQTPLSDLQLMIDGAGLCADFDEVGAPIVVEVIALPRLQKQPSVNANLDELFVRSLDIAADEEAHLALLDSRGVVLRALGPDQLKGQQTVLLIRTGILPGIYYLSLVSERRRVTVPVVLP